MTNEAIDMAIEALSAVCDDCIWHVCNYNKVDWDVPSAEAVQVTGKLKNPCDSLLTDDPDECKEQKCKLADAIEVVRCRDCRMTKERDEYTGNLWCCRHRELVDDMYYCADGERREP